MAPNDTRIRDLASFDDEADGDRAVAGLYALMHLDCLVDLAHRIAKDFFARPQMYRDVGGIDVAAQLARLATRYGHDEEDLGSEQRRHIFASLFGKSESGGIGVATGATDDFASLRDQLLAACVAFSERVFDTGEDSLRQTVRIMHIGFKDYLEDLSGDSVRWSRSAGLPSIAEQQSYVILRNPRITGVFGITRAPGEAWPYREDADGTKLVEEASGQLAGEHALSRAGFINQQRLALRGAEAIATIIEVADGDPDDGYDRLIANCYAWHAARGRVLGLPLATVAVPTPGAGQLMPSASADGNRGLYGGPGLAIS